MVSVHRLPTTQSRRSSRLELPFCPLPESPPRLNFVDINDTFEFSDVSLAMRLVEYAPVLALKAKRMLKALENKGAYIDGLTVRLRCQFPIDFTGRRDWEHLIRTLDDSLTNQASRAMRV